MTMMTLQTKTHNINNPSLLSPINTSHNTWQKKPPKVTVLWTSDQRELSPTDTEFGQRNSEKDERPSKRRKTQHTTHQMLFCIIDFGYCTKIWYMHISHLYTFLTLPHFHIT